MTLNYNANGKEIQAAYDKACGSPDGDKWVIYDYEGNSNTIRVGEEGVGGLDEFAASFSSGRLQFGVIAVKLSSDVLSKIILVHWQGEGVPTLRLASTTSHAEEFRRFLKTVHIVLHARSEIDVEPDVIRKEVRKLPSTNASSNAESTYSIPEKVESVYKPTKPTVDLNHSTREEFWSKMNDEEKRRVAEEKKSREVQQKQYEEDRKRIADEIHSKAENYQPEAVLSVYKPVKPHVELKPSEREQFWNQMNEEEKKRVSEEKSAREAQQKQYEEDRQRTAKEIHTQAEQYQPDRVTSVYKPVKPHVELNSSAREEFWSKMNEEEKNRVAEEKLANEARQKQFDADRKRTNDDIQSKLQSQQANVVEKPKVDANATSSKQTTVVGGLVGSRKEIFNNKGSEPAPLPKPSTIGGGVKKWPPVATNHENERSTEPVNRRDEPVVENNYNSYQEREVEEPKHTYVPEPYHPAPTYDAYEEPPAEPAPAPPALNLKSVVSSPPKQETRQVILPPAEPTPTSFNSQYDAPPEYIPAAPKSIPSHIASQYDAPPEPSEPEEEKYEYAAKTNAAPAYFSSQYDMPPVMVEEPAVSAPRSAPAPIDQYDFPPSVDTNEQRAMALWDYQAADDTEISFDPDDVITEIDQVDSGWWKGRAPSGRVGLFPANYVKLM